jgi:hypothetical protein
MLHINADGMFTKLSLRALHYISATRGLGQIVVLGFTFRLNHAHTNRSRNSDTI